MANKFSDFSKEEKVEKNKREVEDIEKVLDKYSKLSSDQLMTEFIKETKKGRKNGTINSSYLSNIKNTLSPYLNDEQKGTLKNLMDMIDDKQN